MDTPIDEKALREELVTAFGLTDMTDEDSQATVDNLMEALTKTIFLRTFERIGDEGVAEYEKLLERSTDGEQIGQFLEQKIPGYTVFVREIINEFKESLSEHIEGDSTSVA